MFRGDLSLAVVILRRIIHLQSRMALVSAANAANAANVTNANIPPPPGGVGGAGGGGGGGGVIPPSVEQGKGPLSHIDGSNLSPGASPSAGAGNSIPSALISLVAVCIAGYFNCNQGEKGKELSKQQCEMWTSMCRHVIQQLEEEMLRQQGQGLGQGLAQGQGLAHHNHHNQHQHHSHNHNHQHHHQQQGCPSADACNYLAACLRFLLCTLKQSSSGLAGGGGTGGFVGGRSGGAGGSNYSGGIGSGTTTTTTTATTATTPSPYASIVDDDRLSLDDRISFAATYLDDVSVRAWLQVSSYTLPY